MAPLATLATLAHHRMIAHHIIMIAHHGLRRQRKHLRLPPALHILIN